MPARTTCALAAALTALAGPALANGRYPSAGALAFVPGGATASNGHPLVMALGTTFGLVSTVDGGATWAITCEPAIGFSAEWDAPLTFTVSGAAVMGIPAGLVLAPPRFCDFQRPVTAPEQAVLDLTVDGRGRRLVAAPSSKGIAISDDDGATWRRGWADDRFLAATIDVAPGHPERIYATGYLDSTAVLLRSDDGAVTFTEVNRALLGGLAGYLAAVDPANPDRIYLRIDLRQGGTLLARSEDGGRTLVELVRTTNPMTGSALSEDGHTLWVGSRGSAANDGIFRSADGGATWQRVNAEVTPLCLRHRAGRLYLCADDRRDGFAFGYSTDGGEHFLPLLSWKDLLGPEACPAGSPGRLLCEGDWPNLRATLSPDGGPGDAAIVATPDAAVSLADAADAAADAADAAATDAAPAPRKAGDGCSCAVTRRSRDRGLLPLLPWLVLAGATICNKRRGLRPITSEGEHHEAPRILLSRPDASRGRRLLG